MRGTREVSARGGEARGNGADEGADDDAPDGRGGLPDPKQ